MEENLWEDNQEIMQIGGQWTKCKGVARVVSKVILIYESE
jgi:hypothetical protein